MSGIWITDFREFELINEKLMTDIIFKEESFKQKLWILINFGSTSLTYKTIINPSL